MVVADAVLVDVVHAEAAGLPVVLAVARALDGAVARGLHHREDDGLGLRRERGAGGRGGEDEEDLF